MTATSAAPAAAKKKTPLLPKSLQDRALLDEVLEVPATLDEYFDLLPDCEYRIDYSDGKIITMGYASITHEALVGRLIYLLSGLFGIDGPYHVLGSNVSTFIPDARAVHNPDVVVLHGKPQHYVHQGKKRKIQTLLNPFLIVEVLSTTTARFDLGIKLPRYKTIPSVQHILVVSQHTKSVSLYSRTNRPNQWLNVDVDDSRDGYVTIERKKLRLADIYKNIEEA
ncbi:MAG: Uma2 family endonuclease [Saprospiraceae bacterium]|jgi:Uma2 family endonuclease|nr:Uma2 family endonuclease [Saprospiraceae bacterium]